MDQHCSVFEQSNATPTLMPSSVYGDMSSAIGNETLWLSLTVWKVFISNANRLGWITSKGGRDARYTLNEVSVACNARVAPQSVRV